jgi:hypothetical protein
MHKWDRGGSVPYGRSRWRVPRPTPHAASSPSGARWGSGAVPCQRDQLTGTLGLAAAPPLAKFEDFKWTGLLRGNFSYFVTPNSMEGVSLCGAPSPSFYPFIVTAQRKNEDIELMWRRKFTRIRDFLFFLKNISPCRRSMKPCFHRSDFQSNFFSYAIFILKKRPLYVNFSIPPCGNWWFSQGSTPPVGMRFCGHVPNSPRNKNPKRHTQYLLEKVVFLDPKILLYLLGRGKKNFFFNFECYDLANGKEWECEIC